MRLGADVDSLERLGADMDRHATTLAAVRRELSMLEAATIWTGPDATRFRNEWRGAFDPAVSAMVRSLSASAADARRQATQQRITSIGWGVELGLGPALVLGGASRPAVAELPAPPSRVRLYSVEVAGGAEIVGGARAELRVEDLADGKVRITEITDLSAGVGAGVGGGASVSWGGTTIGATGTASAALHAMVGGERSWVIPESDLEPFLVSQAVGMPGDIIAAGASSVIGVLPFGGVVAESVGLGRVIRDIEYDPPTPERIGVRIGASADVDVASDASGAAALAAALGVDDVAAVSLDPRSGAMTISLGSAFSGALDVEDLGIARPIAGDATGTYSLTVDAGGRPTELAVDITAVGGDEVEHMRVVLDLTTPDVRGAASDLVDSLTGRRGAPAIGTALESLVVASVSNVRSQVSTYDVGHVNSYGIEIPVGSLMVTTRELNLQR